MVTKLKIYRSLASKFLFNFIKKDMNRFTWYGVDHFQKKIIIKLSLNYLQMLTLIISVIIIITIIIIIIIIINITTTTIITIIINNENNTAA